MQLWPFDYNTDIPVGSLTATLFDILFREKYIKKQKPLEIF